MKSYLAQSGIFLYICVPGHSMEAMETSAIFDQMAIKNWANGVSDYGVDSNDIEEGLEIPPIPDGFVRRWEDNKGGKVVASSDGKTFEILNKEVWQKLVEKYPMISQ